MTEAESIEIRNLLAGVALERVAAEAREPLAKVLARFDDAMRRVAEYQLVHCVPFFPVGTLAEARRSQIKVLDVLGRIERWDAVERGLMLDLLKGNDVSGYELERAEIEAILKRTLDALPNYLNASEIAPYGRSRRTWLAANRKRAIALIERFVSFKNPLGYKHIEHIGFDQRNAEGVATFVATQG